MLAEMTTNYPETVIGDQLGISFPTTIEPLFELGANFLTKAFHATGTMANDNRVTAVTSAKEFYGGGMGRKLLLTVQYERPDAGLHTHLFVKFPRNFGDPLRDLFGPLMEPEVRFALLSRRDGFPIAVPKCYFADYNAETVSGILVTERIAYGEGAIEARHEKCLDYQLRDPLEHYRALTRAMGRLAGFHKAGKFGVDTDRQFPFDANKIDVGARIPYTPQELKGKLDKLKTFAREYPQLVPGPIGSTDFLQRFSQEALLVLEQELHFRQYLNGKTDYIALCHWNMNLDNAWFWSDTAGELHAGLLDWGSVGQMNVAQGFYGMMCAAEADLLNAHRRGLLSLFVDEYTRAGGPVIQVDELAFQVKLSVALLGIAWILDAPTLVEGQIPDLHTVRDRYDPKIKDNFLARAQLHLLTVLLNEWMFDDVGAAITEFTSVHER
jgi:hypothetical protein